MSLESHWQAAEHLSATCMAATPGKTEKKRPRFDLRNAASDAAGGEPSALNLDGDVLTRIVVGEGLVALTVIAVGHVVALQNPLAASFALNGLADLAIFITNDALMVLDIAALADL